MQVSVNMKINVKSNATPAQIEEWLKYKLGVSGFILEENPLVDEGIEAEWLDIRIGGSQR